MGRKESNQTNKQIRGKLKNKESKREKKRIRWKAYSAKKVVLCIKHQREVSLDRLCRRLRVTSKAHAFEAEHERARLREECLSPHHKSQGFLCLYNILNYDKIDRERSGSVVECLTRDRGAAGSSLIGVTALWSFSKTHLS